MDVSSRVGLFHHYIHIIIYYKSGGLAGGNRYKATTGFCVGTTEQYTNNKDLMTMHHTWLGIEANGHGVHPNIVGGACMGVN